MIKNILFIYLFITSFFGYTQQEKDSLALPIDKNQVLNTRTFQEDLSKKYAGSEFNYSSKEGEAQNLIIRFLQWFFNWVDESFGINLPPYSIEIIEYIIYFLMGALIIYLFIRFFLGENFSSLFTKKARTIIDINLSEDHIENIDLDSLLQMAINDKDYRLAVRYQFLRILKTLSEKELIQWHYEKTNSDYQHEIDVQNSEALGLNLKSGFKEVSYLYDYIWYGEQNIDADKYKVVENRFTALKKLIGN